MAKGIGAYSIPFVFADPFFRPLFIFGKIM